MTESGPVEAALGGLSGPELANGAVRSTLNTRRLSVRFRGIIEFR